MLDLSINGELNPLGYNHPSFKTFAYGKESDCQLMNGATADFVSSPGFSDLVGKTFGPIAPNGLNGITLVNYRNATGEAVKQSMIER